jgi:hypothetical protein
MIDANREKLKAPFVDRVVQYYPAIKQFPNVIPGQVYETF